MKKPLLLLILFLVLSFCLIVKAQWVQTNAPNATYIWSFASIDSSLFVGTTSGVYLSNDDGKNWTASNNGLTDSSVNVLTFSGKNLFAGTSEGGIFFSSNEGGNWTAINNGLPVNPGFSGNEVNKLLTAYEQIYALTIKGTNIYAGTYGDGIFFSSNNGSNWNSCSNGLAFPSYVMQLAVHDSNLYAVTYTGVYLSTDNGEHWICKLSNSGIWTIDFCGDNLFAGSGGEGIFLSTDNGTSWTIVNNGLTNLKVRVIKVKDENIFAGTEDGVFLSRDNGGHWVDVSSGLTQKDVWVLSIIGPNLYAAPLGRGIWRRPISEMITSVNKAASQLPDRFYLAQNYPNPFNPSTTIKYNLPQKDFIDLEVYDILGRKVKSLVNKIQNAGQHEVTFYGNNFPSGVYFCRLSFNGKTKMIKMLILK